MMLVLRVACLRKCGSIHFRSPSNATHRLPEIERSDKEKFAKASCNLIISKTAPSVRTQRSTNITSVISTSVCRLDELSMSRSAVAYVERIGRMRKSITLVRKSEERTWIWKFVSESKDNIKITFEVLLAEYSKTIIFWPVTPWSIKMFLLHRRQQIPRE
jgi:hypothetical protein